MGRVPFWPECLHIKFQKIYLCKAIFYIFEIRFRKIKICNVIFYLRQINSPEFKYVISWVVRKAMCLRRRFSQGVSSSDACIAPRILDFSQELGLFWCKVSMVFSPAHQESFVFHRSFALLKIHDFFTGFSPSDATFPALFHSLGPIAPGILGFLFPSSDEKSYISPHFGPTAPQILGFSQNVPLLLQHFLRFSTVLALLRQEYWSDAKFPTCAYKHTTCTSRICKILQIF